MESVSSATTQARDGARHRARERSKRIRGDRVAERRRRVGAIVLPNASARPSRSANSSREMRQRGRSAPRRPN